MNTLPSDLHIVLIPGLGTDRRIFYRMMPGLEKLAKVTVAEYLEPLPKEPTAAFAERLLRDIPKTEKTVIIGFSLGGILGIEASMQHPQCHLILMASVKRASEKPGWMRILQKLRLQNLMSPKISIWFAAKFARYFGVNSKKDRKNYVDMLRNSPKGHLKWGRNAIIFWKRNDFDREILHLHGTKDHILPHKRISNPTSIQKGTHNMVVNRADELVSYIQADLEKRYELSN